jgi:hypothetical protein
LTVALSRRWLSLSRTRDRGAVAVLVTVVLGGGVLLGVGALVIDVGQIYAEREQLQSGADAAAMAVAQNCIRTPAACGDQTGAAEALANGNSADGVSAVTVVCGRGPKLQGGVRTLPDCPAPVGNRADCMGAAPSSGNYAEVHTATELAGDKHLLPPTFAGALAGNSGYEGTRVGACARVAWGPPLEATGLGVTVSICEWQQMTHGTPAYYPPGTLPPTSAEGVIHLHDPKAGNTCQGPSGADGPGGFGWLDSPNDSCMVTVSPSRAYGGDNGNGTAPMNCKSKLQELYASHRPVLLPVYDEVQGSGSHLTYHLSGFSSFVLTGYAVKGDFLPSWLTGSNLCTSNSQSCLYGYFTTAILPTGGVFGSVDYGTNILKLVG